MGPQLTGGVLLGGGLLVAALAFPPLAAAHGIVGRADLPIPVWLFSWAAAIVLVVSFVGLSVLWRTPRLQREHRRRLCRLPSVVPWLCSALGLALFGLVIYSGFFGAQEPNANFAVTFVYVVFWVGTPLLSGVLGDIFPALSPWRSTARFARWTSARLGVRRRAPLRYPARLGMWPAVTLLLCFGWLELVYVDRDVPSTVAALSLAYFALSVAGMLLFGIEEWAARADGFGAYFSLVARLSAFESRGRSIYLRRPLSGAPGLRVRAGTVALVCTVIGITTFDGLSNGGYWKALASDGVEALEGLGLSGQSAFEIVFTLGLLACVALVASVYRVGIGGVRRASDRYSRAQLTAGFVHTLVPIGFAYVLAHYFSFVVWQGQAMGYLISDPLGNGANLFGTGGAQIDYRIVSYAAIWYVQVGALLAGHVGGLALAHDRALAIYGDPESTLRSQYWMLGVMVAFTSFGLWLLSAVGT